MGSQPAAPGRTGGRIHAGLLWQLRRPCPGARAAGRVSSRLHRPLSVAAKGGEERRHRRLPGAHRSAGQRRRGREGCACVRVCVCWCGRGRCNARSAHRLPRLCPAQASSLLRRRLLFRPVQLPPVQHGPCLHAPRGGGGDLGAGAVLFPRKRSQQRHPHVPVRPHRERHRPGGGGAGRWSLRHHGSARTRAQNVFAAELRAGSACTCE